MEKIEKNIEHQLQNFAHEEPKEQTQSDQISPYIQEYKEFFAKQLYPRDMSNITQILNLHKISYSPNNFSSKVSIIKQKETKYSKVVTLSVSFSYFNFIINILNLSDQPFSSNLRIIGKGSQGTIHQVFYDRKLFPLSSDEKQFTTEGYDKLAIKRSNYQKSSKKLKKIIVEYCYSKFSSALKIGPLIYDLFGFDLIVSKEYIEFGMEICTRKQVTDGNMLKDELFLLHFFNIIHGDIKPQNIMWSFSYKKLVFIDYGFTNCWDTKLGHLSKTSFIGTYGFCCHQMKDLFRFTSNQQHYVDLYYNDLYGLQQSLKKMKQSVKEANPIKEKPQSKKKIFDTNANIFNIRLQKLIFEKDIKRIKQFRANHQKEQISAQTIQLLSQIFPNKGFYKIFSLDGDFHAVSKQKQKICELSKPNSSITSEQYNYHLRIKEEFSELATESYFVEMNKFFSLQDISQKAKLAQNQLYKKIMSGLYPPQNKYFWKMFLSYVRNLFTQQKQVLQMFAYVKQLAGVNQMQKKWSIAMQAWQIIEIVSEKYGHDLIKMNYQLQGEECFNLQRQMIDSNFYSKQPYATINAFSLSSDLSNDHSSQYYQSYHSQMERLVHRVKLEVEKKYEDKDQTIVSIFLFFLQNYFHLQNLRSTHEKAADRIRGDYMGEKSKLFFETMKRRNFTNLIGTVTTRQSLMEKIRIDNIFYNYTFDYEYLLEVYFYTQILSKVCFDEQVRQLAKADQIVKSLIKWTQKYLHYRKKIPCFRNFFQYLMFLYGYCHQYIHFRGYYLIIDTINQLLILFYQKFKFVDKFQIFCIFPIREQYIGAKTRGSKYNEYYQDLMNNKLHFNFTLNQQISLYRKYLINKIQREVSASELLHDLQRYQTNVLQKNAYSKLCIIYNVISYVFIKNQFSQQNTKLKQFVKHLQEWYQWYVQYGSKLKITDLNSQQMCTCALTNLYIFCQDSAEKALSFILSNKFKSVGLKQIRRIIHNLFRFIDIHYKHRENKIIQDSILSNKYSMIKFMIEAVRASKEEKILENKSNQIGFIMEKLIFDFIEKLDEYEQILKTNISELISYENEMLRCCLVIREYCSPSVWPDQLLTILSRKMFQIKITYDNRLKRKLDKSKMRQFRKIKCVQSQKQKYVIRKQILLVKPVDLTSKQNKNNRYLQKREKIARKMKKYQINKLEPYENMKIFCPSIQTNYQRESY